MSLFFLSLLAGMLSVLAPCVLPVLPVILGSSLGTQKWYRPLIIILSASVFITVFTIVLKVSTAFIAIPQSFWEILSATIIIGYGVILILPHIRDWIAGHLKLGNTTKLASQAKKQ